jgi:hypothetical protein
MVCYNFFTLKLKTFLNKIDHQRHLEYLLIMS